MSPNAPVITAFYTGILGLLAVMLAVRVIVHRVRLGIEFGDGGKLAMAQVIRAHANFTEHVPLVVVLIALLEVLGASPLAIHGLSIGLVGSRFLSAMGLSRTLGPSLERQGGASLTLLIATLASIYVLVLSLTLTSS